ncbi:accelerated cell death 1, partial [Nannochloropsis gaditana CCMP526]|uniref:accelerated cell death 1 n=1 Tax=Nannochloropsis gaditana (strain CCMP526) TaxID=1093141 RepID=UPI00029F6FD1
GCHSRRRPSVWRDLTVLQLRDSSALAQLSFERPSVVRALDASRGWINTSLAKGCKTMWTGIFDRIPALSIVVPPYYN